MINKAGKVYRGAALVFNLLPVLSLKDPAIHWGCPQIRAVP